MGRKTPDFENYPKWTEARFFSFIRSALRKAYSKYPPKFEVMKEARRPCNKGRQRWEYQCDVCKNWFAQKEIELDHLVACGSLKSWEDLTPFAKRLFCGKDGLRVVCKPCHKEITKKQRDAK